MSNGLDWAAIRAEYVEKATPFELTIPTVRKKVDPFANGGRHTGSEPRYDRAKMVRLYGEGMNIDAIAAEIGCHRSTVFNNLKAAGVQTGRKRE